MIDVMTLGPSFDEVVVPCDCSVVCGEACLVGSRLTLRWRFGVLRLLFCRLMLRSLLWSLLLSRLWLAGGLSTVLVLCRLPRFLLVLVLWSWLLW